MHNAQCDDINILDNSSIVSLHDVSISNYISHPNSPHKISFTNTSHCTNTDNQISNAFVDTPEDTHLMQLKSLRTKNQEKLIFAHININSIRNKFIILKEFVKNTIDILLISETKIDDTFPSAQFLIEGFQVPFRLDRTGHGEAYCYI